MKACLERCARAARGAPSRRARAARAIPVACALLLLAWPGAASARQTRELEYPFEHVWGSVVRLLRVDYGFPIRDRDEDIGYVLFDYQDGGRSYQGSVELVRVERRTGRAATGSEGAAAELPGVRVVMHIPSMPSYVERMILDRLERKLREDFGLPVEPRRPAAPPSEQEPPARGGEDEPPVDGDGNRDGARGH